MSDFDEILESNPLLAFSGYTHTQAEFLVKRGNELNSLSKSWKNGRVEDFHQYYGDFWLWLLGAYEVFRTISQNKTCFSANVASNAEAIKRDLSELRIPFAKQELRGRKGPIWGELSITRINRGMVFNVSGNDLHTEDLVDQVIDFFGTLKRSDIVGRIPEASSPHNTEKQA